MCICSLYSSECNALKWKKNYLFKSKGKKMRDWKTEFKRVSSIKRTDICFVMFADLNTYTQWDTLNNSHYHLFAWDLVWIYLCFVAFGFQSYSLYGMISGCNNRRHNIKTLIFHIVCIYCFIYLIVFLLYFCIFCQGLFNKNKPQFFLLFNLNRYFLAIMQYGALSTV